MAKMLQAADLQFLQVDHSTSANALTDDDRTTVSLCFLHDLTRDVLLFPEAKWSVVSPALFQSAVFARRSAVPVRQPAQALHVLQPLVAETVGPVLVSPANEPLATGQQH